MKFELPALPYPQDALQPYLSAETLTLHHDKHHQGYLDKLKRAIAGTAQAEREIERIIQDPPSKDVFNNAAQFWNHSFYWQCLSPEGASVPKGPLAGAIERDIGSIDDFKRDLGEAATGEFGSGWAWLVGGADGKLRVVSTSDADTPIRSFQAPILTIDMWEHAYYVDYRNEKDRYVRAYLDHLINWGFAQKNYERWIEHREAT